MKELKEELKLDEISKRRQDHYVIMTIIYDELTFLKSRNGDDDTIDSTLIYSELMGESYANASDYVKKTIDAVNSNYGKIANTLIDNLVGWEWNRLSLVLRSILLMSYAHYYYVEKIAKAIIIDVAIKLTREYIGEEEDVKFVNAILDKVLK